MIWLCRSFLTYLVFQNIFFFNRTGIENSHNRFLIAIRFLLIERVEEVVVRRGFTGNGTKQWRILTGGRGHPDPEIREGGGLKKLFPPFLLQFGLKIRGGGGGLEGPPGPSPCCATAEIRWNSPPRAFSKNYYMELERELLRMTELFTP